MRLRSAFLLPLTAALVAGAPDAATFAGLGIRNIGPAVMGGRISAIDGVLKDGRITLFVGAASGGVWRSYNGGTTFKPVFDKYIQSIGAVKIDPSNAQKVWVGTGEGWTRNSVSIGDGIYKSTDGGDTWTNMGLKDSEHIAALAIDPRKGDVVYAAALGHLWGPGGERGLFKTEDGGKTWTKILDGGTEAGCASVVLDPQHPDTVYATMWEFRREPWAFHSGGSKGGVLRSTDGGKTWTRLNGDPKRGLPMGELGRSAFAVAPSNPKVVYCLVEAKDGALFRSEDGGETWKRGNDGADILIRPFYFSTLFVDPKNPDRIYKPGLNLTISEDGGKTFSVIGNGPHGDWHAAWIDPSNPDHLYGGNDGGFYETVDRGASWLFHRNLPVAQYYHVALDQERPYNTYGGLQDNSSWRGPSRTGGSIQNRHWKNLYGGDGFWVQPDPTDPDGAYAEAQGGEASWINMKTMESRFIQPQAGPGEPKYRWNWNTPIVLSPSGDGTIYMGCQFLFRSKDRGLSWERLGGDKDLTTNDPAKQKQEEGGGVTVDNSSAENHCTIYAIAESPRDRQVLWVGTDDGNLQLSRDGGKTFTNLAGSLPGAPKAASISWIEASPFEAGTAFVTVDAHAMGTMGTFVYRTTDFGKTWKALSGPGLEGYAHVVRQDPVNKDLLYLGTELGLFISLDGGTHWAPFKRDNFPKVAVRDIAIHPREKDLVLATHGRGIWIIDDLTPLRALTPEVLAKSSAPLPARPAERSVLGFDGWADGDGEYDGQNPLHGAVLTYHQQKRHYFGPLRLEVLDAGGKVLATIPGSPRRGINRVTWDMLLKGPRVPAGATAGGASTGPRVPEGTYTFRLVDGEAVTTSTFQVVPDPLSRATTEDRRAQFDLGMELFRTMENLAYTTDRMVALRDQARSAAPKDPRLAERLKAFAASLETLRGKYVPVKEGAGITGEERFREHLSKLYYAVVFYDGKPAPSAYARREALAKDIAAADQELETLLAKELPALSADLKAEGKGALVDLPRAAWEARTASSAGAPPKGVEERPWMGRLF